MLRDTRVSVMMRIMAQTGPLTSLLGDPHGKAIAKVLDQSILVGNMEQTIHMLADSTELVGCNRNRYMYVCPYM